MAYQCTWEKKRASGLKMLYTLVKIFWMAPTLHQGYVPVHVHVYSVFELCFFALPSLLFGQCKEWLEDKKIKYFHMC